MLKTFLKCSVLISCLSLDSASSNIYSSFDGWGLNVPEDQDYGQRSAPAEIVDGE